MSASVYRLDGCKPWIHRTTKLCAMIKDLMFSIDKKTQTEAHESSSPFLASPKDMDLVSESSSVNNRG